ncbi:MAG: hypothetical protein R3C05_31925, partial [Pirellulaceae bacterium]
MSAFATIDRRSDRWKTFPAVTGGIELVAIVVDIEIKRKIAQPRGISLTWRWRQSSDSERANVPLPADELELSIKTIYGKPTSDVMRAIGKQALAGREEI